MHYVVKAFLLASVLLGHLQTIPYGNASPFGGRLVDRAVARQYGLQRAWVTQIQVNPARNHVVNWKLSYDRLTTVTSAGLVQMIDVTSGRTLWATRVGNPSYPNLGPDVGDDYVALVNGSTLYVLHRETGRLELGQRLAGAPSAVPVLTEGYVYVPLLNGRVIGYPFDNPTRYPWFYQSAGRVLVAPLATHGQIFWGTSDGHLYACGGDQPEVRYRMDTPSAIAAAPVYAKNAVLAVTAKGDLFAIDPANGTQIWRFAAGYPAHRSPAAIGENVFFAAEEPALHCIDAQTGSLRWTALGVNHYAAASSFHVFGFDPYGTLHILDIHSGARVARIPTGGAIQPLTNDQNDRLILLSESGTLQCLHELGAEEPTYYVSRPGTADEPIVDDEKPASDATTTPPASDADTTDPFVDDPLPDQPLPAGPEADDTLPGFDDDNPFGIFGESIEDDSGNGASRADESPLF